MLIRISCPKQMRHMQARGRGDGNRRPSSGRGCGHCGGPGSNNPGRTAGRSGARSQGRGNSFAGSTPENNPPPGLTGLSRSENPAASMHSNGPSSARQDARQGRPPQDGQPRGGRGPGGKATRAHPSGPARGRGGAGASTPRTNDKASSEKVTVSLSGTA